MKEVKMGSVRPPSAGETQPPLSSLQPQPPPPPPQDDALICAEDQNITRGVQLSNHVQRLEEYAAKQALEDLHLQRPQPSSLSSLTLPAHTSALSIAQSASILPLLSLQTNASDPASPRICAQQPQIQHLSGRHQIAVALPVDKSNASVPGVVRGRQNNEDVGGKEKAAESALVVNICGRKVRLSSDQDESSLYSLCRRWVRNDVLRKDQIKSCPGMMPIPKPLPRIPTGSEENVHRTSSREASELQARVKGFTEAELLQHHVENFKNVRKRAREDRLARIARFKPRLCLLFPSV